MPNRRFDFALFKNDKLRCIIEFDGKQHYSYIATWHKTQEDFKKSQLRDNEKTQFCQDHDIPLYRIKYDEDIEKRLEQIMNEIKE